MSPPNVLITRYGEVKIVDFGLAKANSQLEKSEPGIIKGKFGYLSPEVALGQVADGRTDIFAVGIILWEMLAGRRLFFGDTDIETVRQVQSARVSRRCISSIRWWGQNSSEWSRELWRATRTTLRIGKAFWPRPQCHSVRRQAARFIIRNCRVGGSTLSAAGA